MQWQSKVADLTQPRMIRKSQGQNASPLVSRVTKGGIGRKSERWSYATQEGGGSPLKILPVTFAPGMPLARPMPLARRMLSATIA
jgi:hypothetical protein